jgi:hypothetical protein
MKAPQAATSAKSKKIVAEALKSALPNGTKLTRLASATVG